MGYQIIFYGIFFLCYHKELCFEMQQKSHNLLTPSIFPAKNKNSVPSYFLQVLPSFVKDSNVFNHFCIFPFIKKHIKTAISCTTMLLKYQKNPYGRYNSGKNQRRPFVVRQS